MKTLLSFIAGIVVGVAGVTLYQLYWIYGKPVLPTEPVLDWVEPDEYLDDTQPVNAWRPEVCDD